MDLETRKLLPDELRWIKECCAVWTNDGRGFFYNRLPEPKAGTEFQRIDLDSKVYYHRVGTAQAEDVLVYEDPEHPEWESQPEVTADGRYLVLTTSNEKGKLFRVLDAPVLIRIESRAGHGGSTPTSKLIEKAADELAFLVKNLGMETGAAQAAP